MSSPLGIPDRRSFAHWPRHHTTRCRCLSVFIPNFRPIASSSTHTTTQHHHQPAWPSGHHHTSPPQYWPSATRAANTGPGLPSLVTSIPAWGLPGSMIPAFIGLGSVGSWGHCPVTLYTSLLFIIERHYCFAMPPLMLLRQTCYCLIIIIRHCHYAIRHVTPIPLCSLLRHFFTITMVSRSFRCRYFAVILRCLVEMAPLVASMLIIYCLRHTIDEISLRHIRRHDDGYGWWLFTYADYYYYWYRFAVVNIHCHVEFSTLPPVGYYHFPDYWVVFATMVFSFVELLFFDAILLRLSISFQYAESRRRHFGYATTMSRDILLFAMLNTPTTTLRHTSRQDYYTLAWHFIACFVNFRRTPMPLSPDYATYCSFMVALLYVTPHYIAMTPAGYAVYARWCHLFRHTMMTYTIFYAGFWHHFTDILLFSVWVYATPYRRYAIIICFVYFVY